MKHARRQCSADDCTRLEELASGRPTGGLCAAHRRRKRLRQPMDLPIDDAHSKTTPLSARDHVLRAVDDVAERDPDTSEGRTAWRRLLHWVGQLRRKRAPAE